MSQTIDQIKDCQAMDLGYNSFRDLVINPKQDMSLQHLNWCIERSMKSYAKQEREYAVREALDTVCEKGYTQDFLLHNTVMALEPEILEKLNK